jgi:hypothetical protein
MIRIRAYRRGGAFFDCAVSSIFPFIGHIETLPFENNARTARQNPPNKTAALWTD